MKLYLLACWYNKATAAGFALLAIAVGWAFLGPLDGLHIGFWIWGCLAPAAFLLMITAFGGETYLTAKRVLHVGNRYRRPVVQSYCTQRGLKLADDLSGGEIEHGRLR